MRLRTSAIGVAAALTLLAAPAFARIEAYDRSALALDRILSPAIQPLVVSSPAADAHGEMADIYTSVGKNISPAVSWEGAPAAVAGYVIIMEDADAPRRPALHWLVYNIPGTLPGIGRNLRTESAPKASSGMMQGINYAGGVGYFGPNPPPGDPPHHYHIEVFALRHLLKIKPGQRLEKVLAAMNDDVLADGETIATFALPAPANAPTTF
jgi:Raf kinase inhibitor-like YbhB/YbcL family protein